MQVCHCYCCCPPHYPHCWSLPPPSKPPKPPYAPPCLAPQRLTKPPDELFLLPGHVQAARQPQHPSCCLWWCARRSRPAPSACLRLHQRGMLEGPQCFACTPIKKARARLAGALGTGSAARRSSASWARLHPCGALTRLISCVPACNDSTDCSDGLHWQHWLHSCLSWGAQGARGPSTQHLQRRSCVDWGPWAAGGVLQAWTI